MSKKIIFMLFLLLVSFSFANGYECIESDGGQDYFIKGSIEQNGREYVDVCYKEGDSHGVNEYYCDSDNKIYIEEHICPFECNDGACESEEKVSFEVLTVLMDDGATQDYLKLLNLNNKLAESVFEVPTDFTKKVSELVDSDLDKDFIIVLKNGVAIIYSNKNAPSGSNKLSSEVRSILMNSDVNFTEKSMPFDIETIENDFIPLDLEMIDDIKEDLTSSTSKNSTIENDSIPIELDMLDDIEEDFNSSTLKNSTIDSEIEVTPELKETKSMFSRLFSWFSTIFG